MEGWIRLAREIVEKPVFQNPDILKVWIWCLLKATHKGKIETVGKQKIPLEPGQFIFGRFKAAEELRMKPTTIRDHMYWLRDNQSIYIKSATKYSLVTIINWTVFQVEDKKSATKIANNPPTIRQQSATNNNVKNDKNKYSDDFLLFKSKYPRKDRMSEAWKCWQVRLKEGVLVSDLLLAADNYAVATKGKNIEYMMQPTTFLGPNNRYTDYLTSPQPLNMDEWGYT
jgi:hypothetical protein